MYKGKYRKRHSHIRKRTVILSVLLVLLLAVGGVFAKYVLNSTTTEISFTLGNNADKLRFSQDDIKYEITVECKS